MLLYFSMIEPHLMGRLTPYLRLVLMTITFIFTFILPLVTILFLYRTRHITSLEVQTSQERRWPFLITAYCYIGAYYTIPAEREFGVLRGLILGATLAIIFTLIINLYTKISAHMVGIGGLAGAFIAISYRLQMPFELVIFTVIAAAGLIGFARLALKAHTPGQVYAGFFVGMICEMALFLLLP